MYAVVIGASLTCVCNAFGSTWTGFSAPTTFATGIGPEAIATGDFNKDGKLDLAVTNVNDRTVTILLGNGQGGFTAAPASPSTGAGPQAIVVADFNGDGNLDIAVSDHSTNSLTILLGKGDGTFTAAPVLTTIGSNPGSMAVGDFDGDGKLDIAVCIGSNGTVLLYKGDGEGNFNAIAGPQLASGSGPISIAASDFNGDGRLDLAVLNSQTNSTVEIFLGAGNWTFTAGQNVSTGGQSAKSLASTDLNGDGKLDLVVAENGTDPADSGLAVLLGNGDGTFQTANVTQVPGSSGTATYVAVGDFNHDGHQDAVLSYYGTSPLAALLGNGDGTFQTAITPGGQYALTAAIGDFNGDGFPDLAAPDSQTANVSVFLSTE